MILPSQLSPQSVVLVTGGNTGIGFETALILARMGAVVAFTSRSLERGQAALAAMRARLPEDARGRVHCYVLDLASFASVRLFAKQFSQDFSRLDVLINNAGLILSTRQETIDGNEMTFGVNHLGHFLLTHLLWPLLIASPAVRVVNLSSEAHRRAFRGLDFTDLQAKKHYGDFLAYGHSKLANIYFTRELAHRLRASSLRITTNAVHPGSVATSFSRDGDTQGFVSWLLKLSRPFLLTAERGAQTSVYVATSPGLNDVSGEYFARSRIRKPSKVARDDEAAKRLWAVSEQLCSVQFNVA